jgi:hypothetical protein
MPSMRATPSRSTQAKRLSGRPDPIRYVELQPWEPGLPGKAAVFGSIDNPGVAIWAAPGGSPHHYEVMGDAGIGNFIACEISPEGEVSVLFGDPKAADDVVAKDPRLHSAERASDSWTFKGAQRTPQNMHGWQPNTYGKGFVLNDGTPVTWSLDYDPERDVPNYEMFGPHHVQVATDMGLGDFPEGEAYEAESSRGGWHTPVYIAPDGTVHQMDFWPGAEESGMNSFANLPGLKLGQPEAWHFGSAFPSHFNLWGQPCSCTFTKHLSEEPDAVQFSNDTAALAKTAGKLHDFLMNPKSRPDLQTPEGQRWLHMLGYNHERIGDKFDALTPWLTREWKKGRIHHADGGEYGHMFLKLPDGGGGWTRHPFTTDELGHMADFYRSSHPLKRDMGDIMQHDVHSLRARVHAWNEDMQQRRTEEALKGGHVVHTLPNGWTVRNLTTPEELKAEGDAMGHCVGGYCDDVADGRSIIHSLRDPDNRPHATVEYVPTAYEDREGRLRDEWMDGDEGPFDPSVRRSQVVQIQGKSNETPKPEYQEMLKHYFTHGFDDASRPAVTGDGIDDVADLDPDIPDERPYAYDQPQGDYGLADHRSVDWNSLVGSVVREPSWRNRESMYDPAHGQMVYDLARKRQAVPELAQAIEDNGQKWQESFDHWRDMNSEHMVPYPNEEDFSDRDEYNNAMARYEEDEANWADEHPGMQAQSHMYSLIAPHWSARDGGYLNQPSTPTTFSKRAGAQDFEPYQHGGTFDYNHYQPGSPGKGFILPDGRVATWNVSGYGDDANQFYKMAGPHHEEVANWLDLPRFPDSSPETIEADKRDALENGYEYEPEPASWHTPISIDARGNYDKLNWGTDQWRNDLGNPAFERAGLTHRPPDQWHFGKHDVTVIEHPDIEPDLTTFAERRPVLWHSNQPNLIHVGPPNLSHPNLFNHVYDAVEPEDREDEDQFVMTDDRTGHDYAAGWLGTNPENTWGTHPENEQYGWYGKLPPPEVDEALRNHFGLTEALDPEAWHFGKLATTPPVGYHGLYGDEFDEGWADKDWQSIKQHGLVAPDEGEGVQHWNTPGGYTYFGTRDVAHGYATSRGIPGLVLHIDTTRLDPSRIEPDPEEPGSWRYRGTIPPEAIVDKEHVGTKVAAEAEDYHGIDMMPYNDDEEPRILLPWEPGFMGKAYINGAGRVRHWRTEHEAPHHGEVMDALGESGYGHTYSYIEPDGKIQMWNREHPETYQQVADHVGGYVQDPKTWNFTGATAPWHVIESDFDPKDTFYPAALGNPDRSDQRVVIAHQPTRQIFIGKPGTHHGDLIHHHRLDYETISNMPRDERQYYEPVEDSPYSWTKEEGPIDFNGILHYGWIQNGGYGHIGQKPEGVTEALHRRGFIQNPDGSVQHNNGWTFSKLAEWTGTEQDLRDLGPQEEPEIEGPNARSIWWHPSKPPIIGAGPDVHHYDMADQLGVNPGRAHAYGWHPVYTLDGKTLESTSLTQPELELAARQLGMKAHPEGSWNFNSMTKTAEKFIYHKGKIYIGPDSDYHRELQDEAGINWDEGMPEDYASGVIAPDQSVELWHNPHNAELAVQGLRQNGYPNAHHVPGYEYGFKIAKTAYRVPDVPEAIDPNDPSNDSWVRWLHDGKDLYAWKGDAHHGEVVNALGIGRIEGLRMGEVSPRQWRKGFGSDEDMWQFQGPPRHFATSARRFAADQKYVKGLLLNDGRKLTWEVNGSDGSPTHAQYMNHHGIGHDEVAKFIDAWGNNQERGWDSEDYADVLKANNEFFHVPENYDWENGWTFSKRGQSDGHRATASSVATSGAGDQSAGSQAARDDKRTASGGVDRHEVSQHRGAEGGWTFSKLTHDETTRHTRSQDAPQLDTPPHIETPDVHEGSSLLVSLPSARRDSGAYAREMKSFLKGAVEPPQPRSGHEVFQPDPTYSSDLSVAEKGLGSEPDPWEWSDLDAWLQQEVKSQGHHPGPPAQTQARSPDRVAQRWAPVKDRPSWKEFLRSQSIREAVSISDTKFKSLYHNSAAGDEPDWETPKGADPWQPGGEGKGYVSTATGRHFRWAINEMGSPHHAELFHPSYWEEGDQAFHIKPDGSATPYFVKWPEDPYKDFDLVKGTDQWHFGNRGPRMELPGTVVDVPVTGDQNGLIDEPWYPVIHDPAAGITYRGGEGAYHADLVNAVPELQSRYRPKENYRTITEQAQRNGNWHGRQIGNRKVVWWDKPAADWHFAAAPQIIELDHDQIREPDAGDFSQDFDMEQRRPFVYHPQDNQVVIGPPGTYHSQIDPNYHGVKGAIFVGDDWTKSVDGWGQVPARIVQHIKDHFGYGDRPEPEWHFGSAPDAPEDEAYWKAITLRDGTHHVWRSEEAPGVSHHQWAANNNIDPRSIRQWWGWDGERWLNYGETPDDYKFGAVNWQVREWPEYARNNGQWSSISTGPRPWIADWQNKTIHLGQPGWYHADLIMHPDKTEPMGASSGAKGLVWENGKVRHYDISGPGVDEALAAHLSQPTQSEDPNAWHFGGTETLKWNPPNSGKGFIAGDKLYTWNSSGNKPHHYEMWEHFRKSEPEIPSMSAAFAIDTTGNVSKEYGDPAEYIEQLGQDPRLRYGDPEGWKFGAEDFPEVPDPTRHWQGLNTVNGWHVWPYENDDGDPHPNNMDAHAIYMHKHNIPFEDALDFAHYTPHPDARYDPSKQGSWTKYNNLRDSYREIYNEVAENPEWHFGSAEDGEGYEWGFSQPVAQLHFPEGFDPQPQRPGRIPFVWTIPHEGDNEPHVYFGHPGGHHDDILHQGGEVYPGGMAYPALHEGLYDRAVYRKPGEPGKEWIGGYGSVKPRSFNTGNEADRENQLEFYDVPEPQTMGTVADAITGHEPFGLEPNTTFKNYVRKDRPWHDDWHFAASEHQLNYVPGTPGKGLMDKNGVLHTWNTSEGIDGWPSHAEYIGQHDEVGYPIQDAIYLNSRGSRNGWPSEHDAIWEAAGYPSGGDDWKYGAANIVNGGHVFNQYLQEKLPQPKTTTPWQLGLWGKGALLDGKLHLWAVKDANHDYRDYFDPHHDGIYEVNYPNDTAYKGYAEMPKILIGPDGTIERFRQRVDDKYNDNSDQVEAQIAAMHPDLKTKADPDQWTFAKTALWPFTTPIPEKKTPQEYAQGRNCFLHPDRPAVAAEGFTTMCQECYDRKQEGMPVTPWGLNRQASDDDWEEDFDRQMKDRMANPPGDDAIFDLLDQGVPLGQAGKMLKFDDGFTAAWVPDEYGSPHHDDVVRALGREGEAAKYLYVEEDGSTHDLSEVPDEWKF